MSEIDYPAKLSIDYPDRNLNRLTTFFRIFMVIPIAIILGLIMGMSTNWGDGGWNAQYGAVGLVVIPTICRLNDWIILHQRGVID